MTSTIADLRRLNLEQQNKDSGQEDQGGNLPRNEPAESEPPLVETADRITDLRESVDTEVRTPVRTEGRKDSSKGGSTDSRTPVREQARKQVRPASSAGGRERASAEGSTRVLAPSRASGRASARASSPVDSGAKESEYDVAAIVRDAVALKRMPPGGVKSTVDMSPELSTRAKRYSIDHGNIAVRHLFIHLMDAFLTGEGY